MVQLLVVKQGFRQTMHAGVIAMLTLSAVSMPWLPIRLARSMFAARNMVSAARRQTFATPSVKVIVSSQTLDPLIVVHRIVSSVTTSRGLMTALAAE